MAVLPNHSFSNLQPYSRHTTQTELHHEYSDWFRDGMNPKPGSSEFSNCNWGESAFFSAQLEGYVDGSLDLFEDKVLIRDNGISKMKPTRKERQRGEDMPESDLKRTSHSWGQCHLSIICLQEAIPSAFHLNWFKSCFFNFYLKNPVLAKPSGRIFLKEVRLLRYYWNRLVSFQGDSEELWSVQFSHSVVSDSLQPHGLQHARPPCPWPTPTACSNSCPSSQWCHPAISSSVIPFSSCLQSFPESGSFPMSQFFISDGQSVGASASVLPMNIQDWFPLGLTGSISLLSKGTLESLQHYSLKASILRPSAFFMVQLSYPYMTTGKTIALTRWIFLRKKMSLLFNMLPRLVIAFFPRSKHLLISWLQSPSRDFGAQENKELCYHSPLCLSAENSPRTKWKIRSECFIRIERLWGLHKVSEKGCALRT